MAEDRDDKKTVLPTVGRDAPTEFVGRSREAPGQKLAWPGRDRALQRPVPPEPPEPPVADDRTRLVGLPSSENASQRPAAAVAAASGNASRRDASEDPVVGWLVVVAGPGRGHSIEIGFGANAIGRDPGERIALDFGDLHISRERHAVILFDPRTQRFYLQGGDVRNLTYIDDAAVIQTVELKGGESISMGETTLRFVRLCGDDFAWT